MKEGKKMKVNLCCNITKKEPVCYVLYTTERELYNIEEEHSDYAFFVADEDTIDATDLPIYTIKTFIKKYL